MTTYPKTAYQVAERNVTMIQQRVLLRETANYYFFADRYTCGREDKVSKDRVTVRFTFDEAKATLVKKKRSQVERAQAELTEATQELAKAEALTGPTHVDEPIPMPTGPIKV